MRDILGARQLVEQRDQLAQRSRRHVRLDGLRRAVAVGRDLLCLVGDPRPRQLGVRSVGQYQDPVQRALDLASADHGELAAA